MALSDLNQFTPLESQIVEDSEVIYQSIYNLLSTKPGERLFRPHLGLDLDDWLFEIMNEDAISIIKNQLINSLKRFEPRVVLDIPNTKIVPHPEKHSYEIDISFSIIGLGGEFNLTGELTR